MPPSPHGVAAISLAFKDGRTRAEEIILKAVRDHTQDIASLALPELDRLKERFFVEQADIQPRLYVRITDNWIELAVRFFCGTHHVRGLKDKISRQIMDELDAAHIGIASSTYDVVGFPPIHLEGPLWIENARPDRGSTNG